LDYVLAIVKSDRLGVLESALASKVLELGGSHGLDKLKQAAKGDLLRRAIRQIGLQ
jgi:hypothetical protein